MRQIKKGAVDQTVYVEVLDSTSTTGGRKTGLVYNTASLTGYYVRNGGSATAITLATLAAANSTHSDGGFKEVDATNMPGIYRLDLPDAAVASGADTVVITLKGATGMAQVSLELSLVDNTAKDIYDRLGTPAGASASADIAAIKAETATILADTNDIQTRIPAALVSGRIDASVGAMASGVVTAAAVATDAIDGDAIAASAVTEIQSGLATSANQSTIISYIDTEVAAILAAVDTEVAAIKAKTDLIPASPAAVSDIPTANANADALLDRSAGVETGWTVRQAMRIILAVLAGKASGLATSTAVYRDMADSKNRISATVDADGNRSAVTRDAT